MLVVLAWKILNGSGHNFAHAMTAVLSWHVQNYDLIVSPESKLEQNKFSILSSLTVCEVGPRFVATLALVWHFVEDANVYFIPVHLCILDVSCWWRYHGCNLHASHETSTSLSSLIPVKIVLSTGSCDWLLGHHDDVDTFTEIDHPADSFMTEMVMPSFCRDIVIGCSESDQLTHFQCGHWGKFTQNYDITISVIITGVWIFGWQ